MQILQFIVFIGVVSAQSVRERIGVGGSREDNIVAKIYGVALKGADSQGRIPAPSRFPEWVPADGTAYQYKDRGDWTAGFFPGTLWLLYQRASALSHPVKIPTATLLSLARTWTAPLEPNKDRTDTHDVGFMMHDSFGWDALLTGSSSARAVVLRSAESLARRYNSRVGAIRSWGSISDNAQFTVIIDNMMNLEMLYYAYEQTGNRTYYDIATTHAKTTQRNHFRADMSSYHVIDYDPRTGGIIRRVTNQGYADWSCWSRGHAWGIHGYVAAYNGTRDVSFLNTAKRAAEYFISRLPADGVPNWDFDAPGLGPRDTSAAMIFASAMLKMFALDPSATRFRDAGIKILEDTLRLSWSGDARYTFDENGHMRVTNTGFEAPLRNSTIDNNPNKQKGPRNSNTGLVYAGYYLVEAQNWAIRLGL